MSYSSFLNVTAVLLSRGFPRNHETWAVVGNGPLYVTDHARISAADVVVRFNDLNNKWVGERTDVHVLRHPSWLSFKSVDPKFTWHVGALSNQIPEDAEMTSFIHETQHNTGNMASNNTRIFPSCPCGDSCLHSQTWAGPSTGAVALSVLQEDPAVGSIEVFGMNWNGNEDAHIDFKNSTIVKSCCSKCAFNETSSDSYGNQAALMFLILFGIISSAGAFLCLFETQQEGKYVWSRYHRPRAYYETESAAGPPLLAFPPPPPSPTGK